MPGSVEGIPVQTAAAANVAPRRCSGAVLPRVDGCGTNILLGDPQEGGDRIGGFVKRPGLPERREKTLRLCRLQLGERSVETLRRLLGSRRRDPPDKHAAGPPVIRQSENRETPAPWRRSRLPLPFIAGIRMITHFAQCRELRRRKEPRHHLRGCIGHTRGQDRKLVRCGTRGRGGAAAVPAARAAGMAASAFTKPRRRIYLISSLRSGESSTQRVTPFNFFL